MSTLEALGQKLTTTGWCTQIRTDGPAPLLRVWHPSYPSFGDSVSVRSGWDGTTSFYSSTGRWLSRCDDLAAARDAVIALLTPFVTVALAAR